MMSQQNEILYSKIEMALLRNPLEAIVSITVKSTEVLSSDLAVLKFLVLEKKMRGVIVSVDRDYKQMKDLIGSVGIDSKSLYYIDAVTLYTGKELDKTPQDNVFFVDSPSNLTFIDIGITDLVERLGEGFLIFDCLSSLKLYNDPKTLGVFMYDLASKLRLAGIYGVITLIEEDSAMELHSTIKAFCDKNVVIKTGRDI